MSGWLCQKCGTVRCDNATWVLRDSELSRALNCHGNVCPSCLNKVPPNLSRFPINVQLAFDRTRATKKGTRNEDLVGVYANGRGAFNTALYEQEYQDDLNTIAKWAMANYSTIKKVLK